MSEFVAVPGVGAVERKLLRSRYKILLLENDHDAVRSIKSNLDARGLSNVVVATNTATATQKLNENVDAVIADVLLDPSPETFPRSKKGDTWLLENAAALEGRVCVAFTGYANLIDDPLSLDRHNIRIVTKSSDDEDRLFDELEERADSKALADAPNLGPLLTNLIAASADLPDTPTGAVVPSLEKLVLHEAGGLFLEWLRSTGGQDRADIWVNGRKFTPAGLADEVVARSAVGEKLLLLFVKHMRTRMNLPNRSGH